MDADLRRTQSLKTSSETPIGMVSTPIGNRGPQRNETLRTRSDMSMKLSPIQRQAVVTSWRLIKPQSAPFFRKCFAELETKSPKVKQIFYKTAVLGAFNRDGAPENPNVATVDEHVKLLNNMFDDIVQNVDRLGEVIVRIRKIGQAHAHLSQTCLFHADIWDRLGEILMEKLSTHDAVQKTREAGKAWRIIIATITGELRYGFVSKTRSFTRSSASTEHLADGEFEQRLQNMHHEFTSSLQL